MQSKILSERVALLKSRRLDKKGEKKMNLVLEQYRQKAFREGIEEGMEKGMEKGIEKGIEKGVESGKQRMALLMGILAEKGRVEDIKKAAGDKLYLESLLSEFGL